MTSKNGAAAIALKLLMWSVFGAWLLMWLMRPTSRYATFWKPFLKHTKTRAYGAAGSFMLLYSVPIILLSLVGALYLHLAERRRDKRNKNKTAMVKSWNRPVLVRGPLAVSSAAELILLALFLGLLVWTLVQYLMTGFGGIDPKKLHKAHKKLWEKRMDVAGVKIGQTGIVCLACLFFPITRGSVFLQLFSIPFEHAVKYHIWIANIMMVLWTVHGATFITYWAIAGKMKELISWSKTEISGLSGLITWTIGVIIWITALAPIRKKKFELFYYTHQLYLLFILSFALHVGDKLFFAVMGGIFLFFINRFARFLQSRRLVSVLSARMMSSETMEIVFAKNADVDYNPASFLLVNFPTVSPLQWHPFTVTSSSSVDIDSISLLIKCYGGWTTKLKQHIESMASASNTFYLEAAIEGPYGQAPDHYVMYNVLIFIAGGSGISPFISFMKEVMYSAERAPDTRKEIILVWAVKKSEELNILQLLAPVYGEAEENAAKLDIQAYVTRENGIDLEDMPSRKAAAKKYESSSPPSKKLITSDIQNGMLHVTMVLASLAGLLFLTGLLGRYYIYPIDHDSYDVFPRSVRGLFAYLATALGIMSFGGATALLWNFSRKATSDSRAKVKTMRTLASLEGPRPTMIHYGKRPEFHDLFSSYAAKFSGSQAAGVFSCGPSQMQQDVARECRFWKLDYHPLNYDL